MLVKRIKTPFNSIFCFSCVSVKSHFFTLPQLETVFSTFYSLVLLIKTINMYVICIWAYISLIMYTLYKKNNWLRLAEVETVIPHGNL